MTNEMELAQAHDEAMTDTKACARVLAMCIRRGIVGETKAEAERELVRALDVEDAAFKAWHESWRKTAPIAGKRGKEGP